MFEHCSPLHWSLTETLCYLFLSEAELGTLILRQIVFMIAHVYYGGSEVGPDFTATFNKIQKLILFLHHVLMLY